MNMPKLTLAFGVILILLGVGAYVASGMASWTALIPSIIGLLFAGLGLLAEKENLRMHAMHAAALLAVLAILGTWRGLLSTFTLLGGGEVERPMAVVVQGITAVLTAGFLVACIQSFVAARRRRALEGGS